MPDETIPFDIPAGTQFGDTVVAEEFGMPRMDGTTRGRAIAQVRVEVPRKLSGEARELLERYAAAMGEAVAPKRSMGERIRDAIDDMID